MRRSTIQYRLSCHAARPLAIMPTGHRPALTPEQLDTTDAVMSILGGRDAGCTIESKTVPMVPAVMDPARASAIVSGELLVYHAGAAMCNSIGYHTWRGDTLARAPSNLDGNCI